MRIKGSSEKYFGKKDTGNIKQKKLFLKIRLYRYFIFVQCCFVSIVCGNTQFSAFLFCSVPCLPLSFGTVFLQYCLAPFSPVKFGTVIDSVVSVSFSGIYPVNNHLITLAMRREPSPDISVDAVNPRPTTRVYRPSCIEKPLTKFENQYRAIS